MANIIFDFDMYGTKDSNGQLKILYDSDALAQAFTKWIVSQPSNKIKSTSGGYIIPHLGKPMTEDTASSIAKSIQDGLKHDFSPSITPIQLSVTPDYANRKWVIKLLGYTPIFKELFNYQGSFNNLG